MNQWQLQRLLLWLAVLRLLLMKRWNYLVIWKINFWYYRIRIIFFWKLTRNLIHVLCQLGLFLFGTIWLLCLRFHLVLILVSRRQKSFFICQHRLWWTSIQIISLFLTLQFWGVSFQIFDGFTFLKIHTFIKLSLNLNLTILVESIQLLFI